MSISKTNVKKYLKIITETKKKVFTCDDLSKISGVKVEVLRNEFLDFYPLIGLEINYDLHSLVPALETYLTKLEKVPVKKRVVVRNKTLKKYKTFVDYIYKKMTFSGGMLDSGYVLSIEDVKILKKLLNNEEKKLNKKK